MRGNSKHLVLGIVYLMMGVVLGGVVLVVVYLLWGNLVLPARHVPATIPSTRLFPTAILTPSASFVSPLLSPTTSLPVATTGSVSMTITPTVTLYSTQTPIASETLRPSLTASPVLPGATPTPPAASITPELMVTFSPTVLPDFTATLAPSTVTPEPTATLEPSTATPEPTLTLAPTPTPLPITPTPSPVATSLPTATSTPVLATQISGCVKQDGQSVGMGVSVELEMQSVITSVLTDFNGCYTFQAIFAPGKFSVAFSHQSNSQITGPNIVHWAWLDGVLLDTGITLTLPDLDISLEINSQHFTPISPTDGASIAIDQISLENPLLFEWQPYDDASSYWVDLGLLDDTVPVWQSTKLRTNLAEFYGNLDGTGYIQAGSYWWSIGCQTRIDVYNFIVYTPPISLDIISINNMQRSLTARACSAKGEIPSENCATHNK